MPKNGLNVSLNSYDDIFSTEETRQEEQREQVQQIPIKKYFPSNYSSEQIENSILKIKTVALTGFLFSLSVEIVQMFGWGSSDINDLIINTAGACLGYWIYYLLSKALPNNFRKKLQYRNHAAAPCPALFL